VADVQFHTEADSCNAYVVFAHPPPDRPANLPPIKNPYEAAQKALGADGSVFQGHTIRVDVVRAADGLAKATNNLARRDAWTGGTDPKKSIFVGGVDYAAKEEDLRVFFEELLKGERGEGNGRYVAGVRIVRDKQTQMGKGFAYVHLNVSGLKLGDLCV
jgi:nucleolar protein 12